MHRERDDLLGWEVRASKSCARCVSSICNPKDTFTWGDGIGYEYCQTNQQQRHTACYRRSDLGPDDQAASLVAQLGGAPCKTRAMDVFQVAQHVDDLPRARAFYERLLNAAPVGIFDSPGMVFFQAGPVRLLLQYSATSALIYLKVDNLHATIDSLRADDVEIVTEPYVIFRHSDDNLGPAGTDEWLSFIRDSEGNLLGLLSHQRAEHS